MWARLVGESRAAPGGGDGKLKGDERELPYAWVILALAFLAAGLSMGIRSTIGLLFRPWEAEFGWDRAAVSLTASLGFLAYGVSQPVAGRLADRHGPRRVFAGSLCLLGLTTAGVALIRDLWHAYLIFGFGLMLAVGGASSVPAAVAIARWIKRRKALAVGIVMTGAAAGQLILVPLVARLVQAVGWRAAFAWTGLGVLLVGVPLILLLFKDDPPGGREGRVEGAAADERPWSLGAIVREKNFWWLVGGFWICGATTSGLVDTHLIPYAEDIHIDVVTAATAFGVLSAFNVLGTLFAGAVSDRWGHPRVLGWVYAGRALTLVFLTFVSEPLALFAFAVAFGIVDFATVPPTTALSTGLFGRRSGGTVIGIVSLSHQVGSAVGSYAGGLAHDVAGSYRWFFLGAAALCAVAATMSWAIEASPAPAPAGATASP